MDMVRVAAAVAVHNRGQDRQRRRQRQHRQSRHLRLPEPPIRSPDASDTPDASLRAGGRATFEPWLLGHVPLPQSKSQWPAKPWHSPSGFPLPLQTGLSSWRRPRASIPSYAISLIYWPYSARILEVCKVAKQGMMSAMIVTADIARTFRTENREVLTKKPRTEVQRLFVLGT